jgi:hypothetical protein
MTEHLIHTGALGISEKHRSSYLEEINPQQVVLFKFVSL